MLEKWQIELKNSLSSPTDLFKNNLISLKEAKELHCLGETFKIRISPSYAKLIRNSKKCPIRRQAIPSLSEKDPLLPKWATQECYRIYGRTTPWYNDPIGDLENLSAPRLTHRYNNRAILHLSSLCAVYCRFCFRKVQLNASEEALKKNFYMGSLEPAFQYLKKHPEIIEIILTGGDPLSVTDSILKKVFENINQIKTIKTLRIHSRMSVTLPSRFTQSLLSLFEVPWNFQIILVSHFNHPKELTSEIESLLKKIKRKGIILLNQSVLLKGINDSIPCLIQLFKKLYQAGVLPYYLHHPDWTPGTFHFRTSIRKGKKLLTQIRGKIPGPALPQYVLDIPSGLGKIALLEETHQHIQNYPLLSDRNEEINFEKKISGDLYEMTLSTTRCSGSPQKIKKISYLDLYFSE